MTSLSLLKKSFDPRNVVDKYKGWSNAHIKDDYIQNSHPFIICVENINSDFNLAASMRCASFFGARKFIYFGGRKKYDKRAAVGVYNYLNVEFMESRGQLLEYKDAGYTLIALEQDTRSHSINDIQWPLKSLMIFGEENRGISEETLDLCDMIVEIPNHGTVRSLNQACSSAIAMGSYISQRFTNA